MSTETEALKTLQRIEKLLEQSAATVNRPEVAGSASRKVGGSKKTAGGKDEMVELTKQVVRASTRLSLLSDETDKLHTSTKAARGEMFNLAADVNSTRANLFAFSGAARTVADSIGALKFEAPEMEGDGGDTKRLHIATGTASSELDRLYSRTKKVNSAFGKLVGTLLRSNAALNGSTTAATKDTSSTILHTDAVRDDTSSTRDHAKELDRSGSLVSGFLKRFGINLKKGGDTSEWFNGQLSHLSFSLTDALINVVRDIYHLQSQGIQAGDSLFSLYGTALKAGMSLEEYTSLLQDNQAAVIRARSFKDFDDQLSTTTRQLNRLGVFGPAAEKLAASLATNTVVLGISQQDQRAAVDKQVEMFGQLRKSTLMTSDAFKDLASDLAANQNVQEQLLGTAQAERGARYNQLMELASVGFQMGATADASKKLASALIEQRKATAEQRFKAAGYIRQAGAALGMGGMDTEELARLSRKKGLGQMTKEEVERFTELSGNLEQRLQEAMNSGNEQTMFIAEKLSEQLQSTQYGQLQQAAAQVKLQAEAGKPQNDEAGKGTTKVQQEIGQALTALSGFMKNPLADAMVTFGSILAQTVIQSTLLAVIAKNTGLSAGVTDFFTKGAKGGKLPPGVTTAPLSPKVTKVGGGSGILTKGLSSIFDSTFGLSAFNSMKFDAAGNLLPEPVKKGILSRMFSGITGAFSSVFKGLASGMGSVFTGLSSAVGALKNVAMKMFTGIFSNFPLINMIVGAVEELFTGEMTTALNLGDGLGGRLLGALTSAFNSLFTGFTRLVDGGVNWVMEGLGLSFRLNTTRFVDQATLDVVTGFKIIGSFLSEGWNRIKSVFFRGIAAILAEIPGVSSDAPWVKALRESSAAATKEAESQEKYRMETMDKYGEQRKALWEGETTTLRSMGAAQLKAQQEVADKSKKLVATTKDNVSYGIDALAADANRTASKLQALQTAQATPAPAVPTQVGMPQPTNQPTVTPPGVNTAQVEDAGKRAADAEAARRAIGEPNKEETVAVLKQQLQVLQQMLTFWMGQESFAEALAKAQGRPLLMSNDRNYSALTGWRA